MLRTLFVLVALGLGAWATGALGGGYSRTVDSPPSAVAAALADLDIRDQPGSPGTDPSASGGTLPTFTVETTPDTVTWLVMAGDKVATRMIAHLSPVDGGKRTKVTAEVVRGNAPDDHVSPAFRSTGITMGLFATALEDELDKLVFKVGAWGPHCDAIMQKFEQRNMANTDQHNPQNLGQAFAGTSKAVMSIAAMDKELKMAGCPQNANGASAGPDGFVPVRSELGEAGPTDYGNASRTAEPNFEPGKPMIDVSRR
jgi:hypothetical protein